MSFPHKFILFFFFGLFLFPACSSRPSLSALSPEEVVHLYYASLNERDYATMYSLLSDGFKRIDSQAQDVGTFSAYMQGFFHTATGIEVVSVHEASNDGKEARVDYGPLRFGGEQNLSFISTYALKTQRDGWKLILPYGDNIDTTE